jgi:hypothetical protein
LGIQLQIWRRIANLDFVGFGFWFFASSAEFVGKAWLQSSEKGRFSARKSLDMPADIR